MAKAWLIDVTNRTIAPYEYDGLKSAQDAVGGLITGALVFPNEDYLFVNDEGLFLFENFFEIQIKGETGWHGPYAGNGLLVGREDDDGKPLDVGSGLDDFAVRFLDKRAMIEKYAIL